MNQLGYVEDLLRKRLFEGITEKHQYREKLGRMKNEK